MSPVANSTGPDHWAVGFEAYGGPYVLRAVRRAGPQPGGAGVLIAVTAAAVNPTDLLFRAGNQADRVSAPWPLVPGMEFAGTVLDPGAAGARFRAGDRVMGIVNPREGRGGAQAERLLVDAASVSLAPPRLTDSQASMLPMGALTALLAAEAAGAQPGRTVYVSGGSGVIGGFAVAIAAHLGSRVATDAPLEDAGRLRSLGASAVRPPASDLVAFLDEHHGRFDGVIDTAMLGERLARLVRHGGVFVTLRGSGPAGGAFRAVRVSVTEHARDTVRLEALANLAEAGVIEPRVALELPFTHAAQAHELIERRAVAGRIVLRFPNS